jgi:hypothetical protein
MNSYEACSRHINGHLPYCCQCQEESLRELLRQVANGDYPEEREDDSVEIQIPAMTWAAILPLRTASHPWSMVASPHKKLREVATAPVELDDPALSYVVVEIERKVWDELAPLRAVSNE